MEAINAISPREDAGPILIVDDDPNVRELYQQVIAEKFAGYPTRNRLSLPVFALTYQMAA